MTNKHPLAVAMEELKLTVRADFIPLSKSRNANTKDHQGRPVVMLNWRVTLVRDGRDVMTTDYGAGVAHCPGYNKPAPANWERPKRDWQPMVTQWECENGFEAEVRSWGYSVDFKPKRIRSAPIPGGDVERFLPVAIQPDPLSVCASLCLDAGVLDYATFESWAADYGYDTDSRAAEKIYRACLEIALQLRAGLGDEGMRTLTEAAQDY